MNFQFPLLVFNPSAKKLMDSSRIEIDILLYIAICCYILYCSANAVMGLNSVKVWNGLSNFCKPLEGFPQAFFSEVRKSLGIIFLSI